MPSASVTWEAAGVAIAIVVPTVAFCLKILAKLERLAVGQTETASAHRELTSAVRDLARQFRTYRRSNRGAHRKITEVMATHGERIEDHELRLGSLEGGTDVFREASEG